MMTHDDIVDLLSVISAYDNRNPSHAAVLAWGKSAELGRWTITEALTAVHAHFASSTAFLMPAHITERIRAARHDAAMRQPLTHPDPISQARLTALISGAFQALNDDPETPPDQHRAALARRCPFCAAAPGSPCTRAAVTGRTDRLSMHPSRLNPPTDPPTVAPRRSLTRGNPAIPSTQQLSARHSPADEPPPTSTTTDHPRELARRQRGRATPRSLMDWTPRVGVGNDQPETRLIT